MPFSKWRDEDDSERVGGAEQTYYDSLPYPYLVRNDAFKTVASWWLAKGIDHETFFGDAQRRRAVPAGQPGIVGGDAASRPAPRVLPRPALCA